jgi:hypothetical protein
MSTYYYANSRNEPVGPVTLDELQRLAQQGVIRGDTNVIEHGAAAWSKWSVIAAAPTPAPAQPAYTPRPSAPPPQAAPAQPTYTPPQAAPAATSMPDWVNRPPIENVNQVRDALSSKARNETGIGFFSLLFGVLLVIIESFILPGRVLWRALTDLSDWGRAGRLPTTETDLPVLTYQVVVVRAITHLLVTIGCLLLALGFLVSPIFWHNEYQSTASQWGAAIGGFIFWVLAAYFLNILVALIYELVGMSIRLINYVKRLAERE